MRRWKYVVLCTPIDRNKANALNPCAHEILLILYIYTLTSLQICLAFKYWGFMALLHYSSLAWRLCLHMTSQTYCSLVVMIYLTTSFDIRLDADLCFKNSFLSKLETTRPINVTSYDHRSRTQNNAHWVACIWNTSQYTVSPTLSNED